ncbi:DNA-binding helix-turn-helix protein [[Clostridium] symbiosum ATCC 14940]|uniref:DNA-binding helix-turn-helix protein n=2 Tax=Clostridium symbiosum TaxID=1512 RepID=A0ABC9U230_CLOSY|nr:DNA-binding helix-turn-helix protein [[Clostridium] symbiosum ATCC 14940]
MVMRGGEYMDERIKLIRKKLELTQQEFADKLGIARNNIAGYETCKRSPSDAVISLICTKFNINEEWLRTGEGEMFVQRTRNQTITDFLGDLIIDDNTFKKRLIEALAELDERDWESLEKLATKLADKKD